MPTRHIDDGRLNADLALSTIQYAGQQAIRIAAKFIAYMLCRRRADVTEFIRRRCGNAALAILERAQQSLRYRMRRATQADRILPT